ncbi:MAG: C39 family peptidase [Mariniphaga sp.]|nr:C39 family peptidase [Mariniphaga sp.]
MKAKFMTVLFYVFISQSFISTAQELSDSIYYMPLGFSVTSAANRIYNSKIQTESKKIKRVYRKAAMRLTDEFIEEEAQKQVLKEYTVGKFYNSLSDSSKANYRDFFNSRNQLGMNFENFLKVYRDSTIDLIQNLYKRKGVLIDNSVQSREILLNMENSERNNPSHSGISGSKLFISKFFNGARRDIITTPKQSLFLRGQYNNVEPYFPNYTNIQCKNCCGPAAGQSFLEWHNVKVKNNSGTVLIDTKTIQKQLSHEMRTEAGRDYTHFNDLTKTLIQKKYLGSQGYCVKTQNGTLTDVLYMLSQGTPVILLLAWDDNAHYVTVYGYDRENDTFQLANNKDLNYRTLKEYFYWKKADWVCKLGMNIVGVYKRSLFSYCPTGCSKSWAYEVPHATREYILTDWPTIYFTDFNKKFTSNNEKNIDLNFYGLSTTTSSESYSHKTKVSNSGSKITLLDGNTHIITYPYHLNKNVLLNNSVDQQFKVFCKVDQHFIDTQSEVESKWIIKDLNNKIIEETIAKIDWEPGITDPQNYGYSLQKVYSKNIKSVEFNLHGGFRKVIWELLPCENDLDGDGICDEFDPDIDGDGVPNDIDNCIDVYNPEQLDHDNNGIGYECDCEERCNVLPPPCPWLCEIEWDIQEKHKFLDNLQYLMHSGFVDKIIKNPNEPFNIIKGKIWFLVLKVKFNKIIKETNIDIDKEMQKEILYSLIPR